MTTRILFVIRSISHFSYISSVAAHLVKYGNKVDFVFDQDGSGYSTEASMGVLMSFLDWSRGSTVEWLMPRDDKYRKSLFLLREVKSYASYFGRKQSKFYRERWGSYIPNYARRLRHCAPIVSLYESLVPPSKNALTDIRARKPDVVVATPANHRFSEVVEYIKAAKHLKIPTVVATLSWDALSTKGLFHVIPDKLLVWNETHQREAFEIHKIRKERTAITGSPFFDKWRVGRRLIEQEDRFSFCTRIGLDPAKPFFVYLGSSYNIAKDETWFIQNLYDEIKAHPRTRDFSMLVRPHPANSEHYHKLVGEDIVIQDEALPENISSVKDFYGALHNCLFTFGLNTSAMIDSVIVGTPCFTVLVDKYNDTQNKAAHFEDLSEALDVSYTIPGVVSAVVNLLDGKDLRSKQREEFVEKFVFPSGTPAGMAAAKEILKCVRRVA